MADTTITLNHVPQDEAQIDDWAQRVSDAINATIREQEVAADQYCWRLSINHKHWLLNYSAICDAAWLEPLENVDPTVIDALNREGFLG